MTHLWVSNSFFYMIELAVEGLYIVFFSSRISVWFFFNGVYFFIKLLIFSSIISWFCLLVCTFSLVSHRASLRWLFEFIFRQFIGLHFWGDWLLEFSLFPLIVSCLPDPSQLVFSWVNVSALKGAKASFSLYRLFSIWKDLFLLGFHTGVIITSVTIIEQSWSWVMRLLGATESQGCFRIYSQTEDSRSVLGAQKGVSPFKSLGGQGLSLMQL